MSDEWRRGILVPIFKNKGDVQSCTCYRGIKLMSHTMPPWERIKWHQASGVLCDPRVLLKLKDKFYRTAI
jgi:hypothetical protein